jgi:Phage portal protein, SPP1 Gp6-like
MVAPTSTLTPPALSQAQPAQPQYIHSNADRARQKAIEKAWQAYDGDLPDPLNPMPNEADDNVKSNRCVAIVDRGVDFLFGKELEIAVEDDAPDEAQTLIDATWGRKETRIPLLQDLAMNGAMAGRAFLRILPMGKPPQRTYRLIAVDPSTVSVQTDPQDCETVKLFCTEYTSEEQVNGRTQNVTYREEITRIDPDDDGDDGNPFADVDATWSIQHWTRIGDNLKSPWQPAGEPITWAYPFPPLFSCKNLPRPNSFWGKADITPDIIGLNNALNLVQSSVNRIEKLFGSPILYATGFGQSIIDLMPGKVIGVPPDGKIVAVNLPSDTTNAMTFAMNLRSDIDEQSSVPGVATGRIVDLPRGTMSGIALELLFQPLLKKTEKKRMAYGKLLIDVCKALFVLAGMSGDLDVELAWQSPLPEDDLPAIQAAIASLELGVSKTTGLRNLGMDPDEEFALTQMEAQRTVTNYTQGVGLPPTTQGASLLPPGVPGAPVLPGQVYPPPPVAAAPVAPATQGVPA